MNRLTRAALAVFLIVGVALLGFLVVQGNKPTIPAPDYFDAERIVFFALGDQGSGRYRQHGVSWLMERECQSDSAVNFSLLLGDNFYPEGVNSVDDPLWQKYFESAYDGPCLSGMPFFAMFGNHDHMGNIDAQLAYARQQRGSGRWQMPDKFYTQDFGRVGERTLLRLFVIDTLLPMPAQLQMIKDGLAKDEAVWTALASHHTARSFDEVYGDNPAWIDEVRSLGIDLYLSGHAHNLQLIAKAEEPLYIVSGAGGKRPYGVKQSDELLFGRASLGFVKLSLDAESLAIEFSALDLGGRESFRVSRDCMEKTSIASCVESH